MYSKRFCVVAVVAVGLLVTPGVMSVFVLAEGPVPVERTFGFWALGTLDPAELPDFESEDSIAVMVLPDQWASYSHTIEFADCDCNPPSMRGTVWNRQPAKHVEKAGSMKTGYMFLWLETEECPEPPDVGAHTFTGPDGLILPPGATVYTIRPSVGWPECDYDDEGKYVVTEPGDGRYFVVVTALFSQ